MAFAEIQTSLAWRFTQLLPGTFKRNKAAFAHHDYPIIGPLPLHGSRTRPAEGSSSGPYIYIVVDDQGSVCYVGKSQEESVLKRWIRPATDGRYYWTHSTRGGGCVFNIAQGIGAGRTYELRYTSVASVAAAAGEEVSLEQAERIMISALKPAWNSQ